MLLILYALSKFDKIDPVGSKEMGQVPLTTVSESNCGPKPNFSGYNTENKKKKKKNFFQFYFPRFKT